MCRSRRDALAFHPRRLSPSSSAATSPVTFLSQSNSSSSLASLRSSLPTTPSLYSPSDVSAAILHPQTKPLSPSSFRCSLRGRDVLLHRRQFRGDPSLLPARLADLCKSHHRSLVRLLGASVSAGAIHLVYDFAPGATLSACLRNPNNPAFTPLSSWLSRMQIAADLAQGLDYIHHHAAAGGCVHDRVKSSAVIVSDAGFHAKICHFGAAFLAGDADGRPMRIVGTTGYLAPEVIAGGRVTNKSDVYAFGVVLLELMSGDEPLECRVKGGGGEKRSYEWVSVVERAREVVGAAGWDGDGSERMERVRFWVDKRLKDSFPLAVAEKMVVVAVRCVERDVARRPEMGWVQGKISQLFLESKVWNEKIRAPVEISVTFGPR